MLHKILFNNRIARLDRAIQKKKLDSPVKPENDNKELTFSEL